MRNIKFRFYDKENKTMNYCDLEDLCEDDYWFDSETEVWTALHDSNNEQEKFVAMQYTGLKDKNEKEIFEGDIVKIKNENVEIICEIIYLDTAFRTKKFVYGSYYDCLYYWYANDFEIEVIGNVWEDSDLLNDNKNTESY